MCAHKDRSHYVSFHVGVPEAVVIETFLAAGWTTSPKGWLCPIHSGADPLAEDLRLVAQYLLQSLQVTIAPADTYVRITISPEEVLSGCLGREIQDDDEWLEDDLAYAKTLLHGLEAFLRTCEVVVKR